jgi:hypothetical protein
LRYAILSACEESTVEHQALVLHDTPLAALTSPEVYDIFEHLHYWREAGELKCALHAHDHLLLIAVDEVGVRYTNRRSRWDVRGQHERARSEGNLISA